MGFLLKIFTTRIIVWNIVALIFVKLVFSPSSLQWAALLGPSISINSGDIIASTNEARANYNLVALRPNSRLDAAATEKARDMGTKNYFAHFSPTGVSPWFWMEKNNYRYAYAGENIAIGFINASDTIQAWLNSPSHRANLLNTKYQEIGVATAEVEIEGMRGTLIVQMFGKPATAVAAKITPKPKVIPTQTSSPSSKPAATLPSSVNLSPRSTSWNRSAPLLSKAPPVKLEYASTDEEVRPVSRIIKVETPQNSQAQSWARRLNNTYAVYALAMASLAMLSLLSSERNRGTLAKTAIQVGLFILALTWPVTSVFIPGWIF